MKYFLFLLISFSAPAIAFCQMEKTIHQTFEIGDAENITLDLVGEYEIKPWAGNTIMTETQVQLFDANISILNHFLEKEKRYFIEADTTGGEVKLISFDKKREAIKTKKGACLENVILKVFIPEVFEKQEDTHFVRKKTTGSD
jgi:hypothetical protein